MKYRTMLKLQKCLYFNFYIYVLWTFVNLIFLYFKFHKLGYLSKYLSAAVFVLLIGLEAVRLYLGYYGNLSCRVRFDLRCTIFAQESQHEYLILIVPELAGFLMLTTLMQMPLISFFLFNPYLMSTPTETILHACLWFTALAEIIFSYIALKQASNIAKSIYFSHSKEH